MRSLIAGLVVALLWLPARPSIAQATNTFTIASYNVENWLLMERRGATNQPKPEEEKAAVYKVIGSIHPDALGVCEIGSTNDFGELADGLKERGLDYPFREWIEGGNMDRGYVAMLSRFPIVGRQSRVDYSYQMDGKSRPIERGILDVRFKVNDGYSFRAIMVHLKSKRATDVGDQAVMRLEEARLLRRHIDGILEKDPRVNLIVMGDLNDLPESEVIRTVIGTGASQLVDLMPVNSKGFRDTHYWRWRGEYSRIDYLLVSPGMSNELVGGSARIADVAGSEKASDHRAIYAQFYDHEIGEPEARPALQPAATRAPTQPAQPPAKTTAGSGQKILIGIIIFDTVTILVLVVVLVQWKKKKSGA